MQGNHSYELRTFLHKTSWPNPPTPIIAHRMDIALRFFQTYLQDWSARPVDEYNKGYQAFGCNPYAFKIDGKVTNLTSAMQAIRFSHPVHVIQLPAGRFIRRYGKRGDDPKNAAKGLWYTTPETPASLLALPPDQNVPLDCVINSSVVVLQSKAGDLVVDWEMNESKIRRTGRGVPQMNKDYFYREGGGPQFIVPYASRVVRVR